MRVHSGLVALENRDTALTLPERQAADARGANRSSLYLGAALFCDGASTPVRIRNLSVDGALVEADIIPEVGALVQVVRGTLIVHGLVMWCAEGKCGLKFCGSVDVQQWRAAPTNSEQQRVDDVVKLVKAGAVPLPVATYSEPSRNHGIPGRGEDIGADLQRVTELLEGLGEVLAADPQVVMEHGTALQNLDISMQVIAALQSIFAGEKHWDGDELKLKGLRRSADQALNRL
jgi:hypothetical protein